ncbi:MAG: ImmA/IrrE family metallo-endopeptidase [Dysgonomonas mossii]|uniref:ImmA/IrrE family metallo-endopeptidase n=1 Tax=Dysgonomonas mossii TaxID=163665 RepID=UPI00399465DF
MIDKGTIVARKLIEEFGIEKPDDFSIEELIHARDIILQEKKIANADGRIVFGKSKTKISINSDIKYKGRRRFTLAHELGHFELHHNQNTYLDDTPLTLDYFQSGNQEYEANRFATELLMPTDLFKSYVHNKCFSPDLLRNIAEYFETSITSATFRYLELGQNPISVFYCRDNRVVYWKNSPNYYCKIKDITRLAPPDDSVATEFFNDGTIYGKDESAQEIRKSTWYETGEYDSDHIYYEYAIVTKDYNTVLSVVWK